MPRHRAHHHLTVGIILVDILKHQPRIGLADKLAPVASADDIHGGYRHEREVAPLGLQCKTCVDIGGCAANIPPDVVFIAEHPMQSERHGPFLCISSAAEHHAHPYEQ